MTHRNSRLGKAGLVVALVLALTLAASLLTSCPDRKAKAPTRDHLVVHMEVEPTHLVSLLQPDFWAKRITSHNLFEALIRLDPRTYRYSGELASVFKVSEDGLTHTFYLRKGVKWHDGKPFSGEDVKVTLDRIMDPAVRAASTRATLEPYIKSYTLLAPDRFEIQLKVRSPFFRVALANLDILPAHIIGKGDLNEHPFLRKPVGTGPFKFASWKSGQHITLERWDGYWGAKPRLGKVIYKLVSDPAMALKLARKGEIDFVPRVRPAQWVQTVKKEQVFLHEFVRTRHYPPGITYIMFNHKRPIFSDVRVRRALAMLLDLDTVVGKIMHGIGKRVGPLYWFKDPHFAADIKPIPYDPEAAKGLLAQAGFADKDGDGVLERGGEPLRFTFLYVAASKSQQRWLTIYQQALRKAGVALEINPMDWAAYLERLRTHDFDAAALGMRFTGPFSDLYEQLHSSQAADGQNYSSYANPDADRLMEQIRVEMDEKKRAVLSVALQRLLALEVALVPLFAEEEVGVVSRRVHGVYTSALWYQIRDWWME